MKAHEILLMRFFCRLPFGTKIIISIIMCNGNKTIICRVFCSLNFPFHHADTKYKFYLVRFHGAQ